jgi:RNA polymerase sporulation-specific sigma factor
MLSVEETLRHIRLAKNGDDFSKEILIKSNVLLVKSIVFRFRNKGVDYDDLFQLGCMGLLKAIYNFNESYNVRFSTYAVPMIIGEIKRFLRDDGEIKISRIIKYNAHKISKFIEEFQKKFGVEPTIEKISEELDISLEDVVLALDSSKVTISLYDAPQDGDNDAQTLIEKIPSSECEDDKVQSIYLKQLLSRLNTREQKIIMLRYYRDKTQGEVAKILGVSQVQVSRLENKILKKLKDLSG